MSWQGLKWSFISKVESLFKRELYAAQAASYTIKSLKPPSPIQKKLALLAKHIGTSTLMLISIALLETAVQCARLIPASFRADTREREAAKRPIGGTNLAFITHVLKSPYLLGICVFMVLFTIGTTVLYFSRPRS